MRPKNRIRRFPPIPASPGRSAGIVLLLLATAGVAFGVPMDPWADSVVAYDPGTGVSDEYTQPDVALGQPAATTSFGPVHMFNPPWESADLVALGDGGSLIVAFDEPVADDPLNPFGIDLLIFGNAGFFAEPPDYDKRHTDPAGLFGGDGGTVSVSADGTNFVEVVGAVADGLFPTQPWTDPAWTVPADFTRPVDPSLAISDFDGLTIEEALALYDGSGGGAGIDISGTGLAEIRFVKITYEGAGDVEIDAFADVTPVPEPGILLLIASAAAGRLRRRRTA